MTHLTDIREFDLPLPEASRARHLTPPISSTINRRRAAAVATGVLGLLIVGAVVSRAVPVLPSALSIAGEAIGAGASWIATKLAQLPAWFALQSYGM